MWTLLQLVMLYVFVMHQVASEQEGCGRLSYSGSEGVVTSPDFPRSYPNNMNCTYSIDVGRNNSVLLEFLGFQLQAPNYRDICTRDWLMITCNETNDENLDFRDRYCGGSIPRTSLRFFNCPVVQLMFFSDSFFRGAGFMMEYTVFENGKFADNTFDVDCGDTMFTSSSGVIHLPIHPTEYSASVNCTYTISTKYRSTISVGDLPLHMLWLLDSFVDCNRDYIMIGCVSDGETELNPSTSNKYCRNSFDQTIIKLGQIHFYNCSMVKIYLRSSEYIYQEDDGFPFEVHALDVDCGNTSFTGSAGIISSPVFPLSHPHGLDCVYTIDVDRTKTISLDFLSFDLDGTSHYPKTDSCEDDWLKISCLSDGYERGNRSQENKYCGEMSIPITLNYSNCDSLTFNLVTDLYETSGGFQLHYTITSAENATSSKPDVPDEGCGNTSFTGPVGLVASPRFPLSYPNSLDCIYSIDVDRTKMVVLRFLSFNIEGTSHVSYLDNCNYDWLMISCLSNGSEAEHHHWNRKYCGEKATPLILSYSNCDSLTLNFVSDSYLTGGGFQLRYSISLADDTNCGNTLFSGPNGVVTSPDFPFPYPHNTSCRYSIKGGRNNSVLLKFKHFSLEIPNSADSCKDWLMISCNETTKVNPNNDRKYCGAIQWTSSLRFVDCPSLILEFVSDSSIRSSGFMIEYTAFDNSNSTDDNPELDCGTTLFTNRSGVIDLPRNPTNYLATVNCTYTISANNLSNIWFHTYLGPEMQLVQSFQDCEKESLTIGCVSEGEAELNPNTTSALCRSERTSPHITLKFSDCRMLKLFVRSTHYDNRETYRITYSVFGKSEICGDTSFSAPYGVISSQHLPWPHRERVNCLYTIANGHVNSFVLFLHLLSFEFVDIGNASCNSGWLTISCLLNGSSVPHPLADRKLCEDPELPIIEFPACSSVLLNYSSDYISYDTEFFIRYMMSDYEPECGNTYFNGPTGVITSPRFSMFYTHSRNCLYSITGGRRNTISLSFLSFRLEGSSNTPSIDSCDSEWLTVSCLSDESATANISSSRRYCGYKPTLRFTFPNCEVVVLNFQSDTTVTRRKFKVRYAVTNTDSLCGVPVYGPPSGVMSFPWNNTDYEDSLNCSYVINATQPSSISLTIWSISLQSSVGINCQSDWLLVTCINGQNALDHRVGHSTCEHQNSSTQLTFPSCAAVQVVIHKGSDVNGKTFRIEYTINAYDDLVVNTQMNLSGQRGHAVGISLTVILVVAGAICLGAFLLFRRYHKKNRSEMLLEASEEETHHLELEDDSSEAGDRNQDRDTSRYLPLRPMSISDHGERSSSNSYVNIHSEIQPGV